MKKRTNKILLITFIVIVLTMAIGSTVSIQYYCRTKHPDLLQLEPED